ncbi:MAG: hypothetical protein AAF763_03775 [Pseudomonadota bacterium]
MITAKIDAFLRSFGQHLAAATVVALMVGGPALVEAAEGALLSAGPLTVAALDGLASAAPGPDRGLAPWAR